MEVPQSGHTLLDGAVATTLFEKGMPTNACVEEFILNHPGLITELQSEFVKAGSDILYAPTFGANRARLSTFSLEDKVYEYNTRLVALCKSIANGKKVAGNLSPTGLQIEPYGETSFEDVVEIYEEQALALNDAGVDLFVIETMLSIQEARAAVFACQKFSKPIFVTFTINEKGKTLSGATPLSCLISLQGLGIHAFGLNCSEGPEMMVEIIKELSTFSKLPLIAKPSAGMPNPILPNVYDLSPSIMSEQMEALVDAGASIIGGCCGTTPEHIGEMRHMLDTYVPKQEKKHKPQQSNDIVLANETQAFALDNDRMEFTDAISCEHDMADAFLAAEEDSDDVLLISINSVEEARQFAQNAHLAKLPVCISATHEDALETALFLYSGRAMVDLQSPIDEQLLSRIAKRYGAVLY